MKNRDFFYLQYNKINWKNQEKTKINSFINEYIIQNILLKHESDSISLFDIGFGVGFFIKMVVANLRKKYKKIRLEGCEPSRVNYDYFLDQSRKINKEITTNFSSKTFQEVTMEAKFDYITAIYVFPHFLSDDFEIIVNKIHQMLEEKGKFILVLANEEYLQNKLKTEQDLFIETKKIEYHGKNYDEILHYSDIPKIGKIVDYNREEAFYVDLFNNNKFSLIQREDLEDNGFICTLYVFEKQSADLNND